MAQVDYAEETVPYGTHNENRSLAQWHYENGVEAMMAAGPETTLVDCNVRVAGTDGEVKLFPDDGDTNLQVRRAGDSRLRDVDVEESRSYIRGAIEHVIDCLESGEEPIVGGRNVLNGHSVVFGCYESVRRRGRVEFPLEFEDNPLEDLVERGELVPQ